MLRSNLCSGRHDCILIDSYGSAPSIENETTAKTSTKASQPIQVTFVIADSPRLSFYVNCPDLVYKPNTREPKIVWSVKHLALLRVYLTTSRHAEYFIYRARGPGCPPSLDLLPDIGSYLARQRLHRALVGLLPHGDGEHFVLAVFGCRGKSRKDKLHVYRSERRAWTGELLGLDIPSGLTMDKAVVSPEKAIALGDGVLGFVDIFRGILVCDVLSEPVTARFVPMPKLLPNNQNLHRGSLVHPFRDVTCTDGLMMRCVELEHLVRLKTSIPDDVSDKDVLYDSELVRDHVV